MIEKREAKSREIRKSIRTVRLMTRGMGFDENIGRVNRKAVRFVSDIGYSLMRLPKGVRLYRMRGISGEIAVPEVYDIRAVIIYIHGGGFVSGSTKASRAYAAMLAKVTGFRVVTVDYRLAPENKYPKGLDDCYKALCFIEKKFPKAKIALCGESAGANLAIATALKARDEGRRSVCAVIAHSPFMDFTDSLDRSIHTIDDFTVKKGCLKPLGDIYAGGRELTEAYISPIYADFKGFVPTLITCDSNETLYADSLALHNALEKAGIFAKMIEMKGAFHAFAAIGTDAPETSEILKETKELILGSL